MGHRWVLRRRMPMATASTGFVILLGSFLLKKPETSLTIRGIRVEPPTKMISWTLALPFLESRGTFSAGSRCFGKSLGTTPRNERGVEIDTLEEGIDFDGGGGGGGEGSLGAFTGGTEATRVGGKVLLILALELLDEVVDEPVYKSSPPKWVSSNSVIGVSGSFPKHDAVGGFLNRTCGGFPGVL